MEIKKVTEEFASECFMTGIDCSQIVLGYAAPKTGLDNDTALKVSSTFGGGMWCGRTCGAVSGALMAIGMKYGHSERNMPEQKNAMMAKKAEFEQKFTEKHGSVVCKDILGGLDLSKPEDMNEVMEKGLFFTTCTKVVCSACKILDGML
ncbi:MAG: C-GCAxxG-C-C family protein [Tannerellaceae bacterium]|jgi:C_GCAxxG_C_C family probable redox protein|nr:C-GCAxxG-C-C family protein [Tannerellaceae bacterium]